MNLMCSFITLNLPYERESLKDYWKSFVQLKKSTLCNSNNPTEDHNTRQNMFET